MCISQVSTGREHVNIVSAVFHALYFIPLSLLKLYTVVEVMR
jgi:hypothetical protein